MPPRTSGGKPGPFSSRGGGVLTPSVHDYVDFDSSDDCDDDDEEARMSTKGGGAPEPNFQLTKKKKKKKTPNWNDIFRNHMTGARPHPTIAHILADLHEVQNGVLHTHIYRHAHIYMDMRHIQTHICKCMPAHLYRSLTCCVRRLLPCLLRRRPQRKGVRQKDTGKAVDLLHADRYTHISMYVYVYMHIHRHAH